MFGLGFIELVVIFILVYFGFRHIILRRFPKFYRAVNFIFYTTAFFMLAFAVYTRMMK